MKKIYLLLLVTFCCTLTFSTFSWAGNNVLNAGQVQTLFNGKTMTVTDPVPDKKTRKNATYEVTATEMGMLRVVGEKGSAQTRTWNVRGDGSFCYSSPISRRRRGGICGYLVPAGSGAYDMYTLKKKYSPKMKIVGAPGSTHILTFSNFR